MTRGELRKMLVGPAVLVGVYLVLRLVFASLSQDEGMFTPERAPDLVVIGLGLGVIGLRLGVIFVLPVVVVARIVRRVMRVG